MGDSSETQARDKRMAVMGDIEMILYGLSLLIKQFTLDGKWFSHPAD